MMVLGPGSLPVRAFLHILNYQCQTSSSETSSSDSRAKNKKRDNNKKFRKHHKDDSSEPYLINDSDYSNVSNHRRKRRKKKKHWKNDLIKLCANLTAKLLMTAYKLSIIRFKMDEDPLQRRIYFPTFVD